jgi:hypothetical protein
MILPPSPSPRLGAVIAPTLSHDSGKFLGFLADTDILLYAYVVTLRSWIWLGCYVAVYRQQYVSPKW